MIANPGTFDYSKYTPDQLQVMSGTGGGFAPVTMPQGFSPSGLPVAQNQTVSTANSPYNSMQPLFSTQAGGGMSGVIAPILGNAVGAVGTNYAANQAANAATQSAQQAAQMAQFRPVGVTTRFGKSGFNYDPTTGQLIGAGYQVAPDIAAAREGLIGMAGGALSGAAGIQAFQPTVNQAAQGLFKLGQSYVGQNPQEVAQNYLAQQQQLLAPGREQSLANLTNQQQQQGRLGLATGGTAAGYTGGAPGLQAANPQMAAYYNAQAMQDAQLAAQAQQAGQQQVQFGQGLMTGGLGLSGAGYNLQNTALSPYTNYMQSAMNIENQGQNALNQGTALGSAAAAQAQAAANQYAAGQATANAAQRAALQGTVAGLTDPISQLIRGLTGGGSGGDNASAVINPYFMSNP